MKRVGLVVSAALLGIGLVLAPGALAKPTPTNGCPNGGSWMVDPSVGASATGGPMSWTYSFSSWVDQNPVSGVPGLIGYCVYTDSTADSVTTSYDDWKASDPGPTFSFTRPKGEKSDIPLDGTTDIAVGTATFDEAPTTQNIVLHVSDASTCQGLYGGDATTCFVLPGPEPGPVCDDGNGETDVGYNAMPIDVTHCSPPSEAFEAQQTNEFGDGVTLDTAGGSNIQSMIVDFQSYGCGNSGHWHSGDCSTTAGQTFKIPGGITANIYDPSDLTTPIATSTIDPDIPYRPSAVDDTNCPNPPGGNPADSRFVDPVSGQCNYSLSVPLTFPFSGQVLPGTVVWTVQFDTSHYGYSPIGEATTCYATTQGCGYDSLNVGVKSYPNAPYAGTDVDEDVAYRSYGGTNGPPLVPLTSETGWTGYRPLGEIILGP
jgi:hypothetical protein